MKRSGIITLTTDFGVRDPYVASVKGVILGVHSMAVLVDVTHEIPAGDVAAAADVIQEAAPCFPGGTVHLAVVDPGVGGERRAVAAEAGGHLFVGPDNGIFWPMLKADPEFRVFHLRNERFFRKEVSSTFHGRDIFAPVAAYLAAGREPAEMGEPVADPVELAEAPPVFCESGLTGRVIRVDRFGNLITNIRREHLEEVADSGRPVIEVGGLRVEGIRSRYEEVDRGEALALIGSTGRLEVSVNRGRASERAGLGDQSAVGSVVRVRF
jgi:hypothetical protein